MKFIRRLFFLLLLWGAVAAVPVAFLVYSHFPVRYMDIIQEHAGNLEPAFILAVIHAESTFRPQVVSHRGAMGLMQIMEPTGEWIAQMKGLEGFETYQLFTPEINIAIGVYFLNWLWHRYDGDITLILSGYNAGIGRVNEWLADYQFSYDGETLAHIPFPETRTYIQRVERNMIIYEWLLKFDAWRSEIYNMR